MQQRNILFYFKKHTRLSALYNIWKWLKLNWSIFTNLNKRNVARFADLRENKKVYKSKGMLMLSAVTALL